MREHATENSAVILRREPSSASLEGWPHPIFLSSFEARKSAHLRMTAAAGGKQGR
jgi:hypothetical protein